MTWFNCVHVSSTVGLSLVLHNGPHYTSGVLFEKQNLPLPHILFIPTQRPTQTSDTDRYIMVNKCCSDCYSLVPRTTELDPNADLEGRQRSKPVVNPKILTISTNPVKTSTKQWRVRTKLLLNHIIYCWPLFRRENHQGLSLFYSNVSKKLKKKSNEAGLQIMYTKNKMIINK